MANNIENMIFVGLRRRVAALDRVNGEIVWEWEAGSGQSYCTMLLDGDRLIVSVDGYTYCLDPLTGRQYWKQELEGFGTGVASLVSIRSSSASSSIPMKHAASAQTASTASTGAIMPAVIVAAG